MQKTLLVLLALLLTLSVVSGCFQPGAPTLAPPIPEPPAGFYAPVANADNIPIALGTGSPTIDKIQEYFDQTGSSGYFTGGVISDGGAGTIDVTAGEGFIRTTDDANAPLLSFKFSGVTGLAITANTTQYVFVDDAGTINLSTNEFIEAKDNIMLGVATDEGGAIVAVFNLGVRLEDSIGQMGRYVRRVDDVTRDKRKGGLLFGETGTRNITLTAGSLWWGRTEYTISALDTSVSGGFDTYSAGGQEATGATQWPNTQYDNAGTLTTMTNNRWAVLWLYIEPDGHVVMLYGRAQYNSEGAAEEELSPSSSIPNRISSASVLAARLIFQKDAATAAEFHSAFEQTFGSAGVTDHGNLAGLADDDHALYTLDTDVVDRGYMLTGPGGWASTTSGAVAAVQNEYTTNDVDLQRVEFVHTATTYQQWTGIILPDYAHGGITTMKYMTYFVGDAAGAANEGVAWTLELQAGGNSDPADASWGTAVTNVYTTSVSEAIGDYMITSYSGSVTIANSPQALDLIQFRLGRNVVHAEDDWDYSAFHLVTFVQFEGR